MPDLPTTYLDHAATTPLRPEAREAMLTWLGGEGGRFGNPSGSHRLARQARRALDDARDAMAEAIGCEPAEVVFTSGGTEADNAAICGSIAAAAKRAGAAQGAGALVPVCSAIEHHAVLDPVLAAGGRTVAVDQRGLLDLDSLAATLDQVQAAGATVPVVSVMLANNEIGVVQDLDAVAEGVRRHAAEAALHTDAIQAFCWLDVPVAAAAADLVSVSAHKFGGPQGVGVLVLRDGTTLAPLLVGGGQERERRSGTQNVAGIVGMAAAAAVVAAERNAEVERVEALRDRLVDGLLESVPGAVATADGVGGDRRHLVAGSGDRCHIVAGSAHMCFAGVESEELLFLLDQDGLCATAGSSCASGALDPSQVLAALGVPAELARGSLRLSLGWTTTDADIDRALAVIPAAVERLARSSSR